MISIGCNNQSVNENKAEGSNAKLRPDSINIRRNILYQISGTILYRKMWCGGVQIRAYDNSYKSKPFNNKKIQIIRGTVNSDTCTKIKELYTNAKGEFTFELSSGIYGIIVEDWKQVKFNPPSNTEDDRYLKKCLEEKYKQADIIIKLIDAPISKLVYTVIGYCSGGNPCNPNQGNNRP